eukprot:m.139582 g.139582  ORF g.139582 m.139582 type:complete len:481 (-) comp14018_c0_seq2:321-1763(-)
MLSLWVASCLLVAWAAAVPCPSNSFFLYSHVHKIPVCACNRGLVCTGPDCLRGSVEERTSFGEQEHGFPHTCDTCWCTDLMTNDKEPFKMKLYKEGRRRDFTDEAFNDICPRVSTGTPREPRPLERISWLHFPKCGSSLTNTIYNYMCRGGTSLHKFRDMNDPYFQDYADSTCRFCWEACGSRCEGFTMWSPHNGLVRISDKETKKGGEIVLQDVFYEKFCATRPASNFQSHFPLKEKHLEFRNGTTLAMFRDPRRRLLSAFNHGRHAFGMSAEQRELLVKTTHTLEAYAVFPGIQSCQTKMLLGLTCGHYVKLTEEDFDKATQLAATTLGFIGIVEYWDLSVCLFHAKFGSVLDSTELQNLRPGVYHQSFHEDGDEDDDPEQDIETQRANYFVTDKDIEDGEGNFTSYYLDAHNKPLPLTKRGMIQAPPDEWKKLSKDHDPLDWRLYHFVLKLFVKELHDYGLEIPEKLRHLTPHPNVV